MCMNVNEGFYVKYATTRDLENGWHQFVRRCCDVFFFAFVLRQSLPGGGKRAKETKKKQMRQQRVHFEQSLEGFDLKYKQDIRKDPVSRVQFNAIYANIGVDPLSSNKVRVMVDNSDEVVGMLMVLVCCAWEVMCGCLCFVLATQRWRELWAIEFGLHKGMVSSRWVLITKTSLRVLTAMSLLSGVSLN